jgi:16S rRNA (guanine(966)-N(2))-methyltransferase RsmD
MKIISGLYKGKNIYSVEGKTARPTSTFNREMIFSTLYSLDEHILVDGTILDLYAGCGSMGFEAFSRGANEVSFIDGSKKSISTIIANAELLSIKDKTKIVLKKVDTFLNSSKSQYDVIFADPPYEKDIVNRTIELIYSKNLLAPTGILVIEHSVRETIYDQYKKYVIKEKINGGIAVSFLSFTTQQFSFNVEGVDAKRTG